MTIMERMKKRMAEAADKALDRLSPAELKEERLKICRECPEFLKLTNQCRNCGCFLAGKTAIKAASCPIGKW